MGAFGNPIIGAGGTLIRALMRSVDFVAGVSGWQLTKDGDAELNNATFRGMVEVVDPATGAKVTLYIDSLFGPVIALQPQDHPGYTYDSGFMVAALDGDRPFIYQTSPGESAPTSESVVEVSLYSGSTLVPETEFNVTADVISLDGALRASSKVSGASTTAVGAFIGGVETVVLTAPSRTYKAGRLYEAKFSGSISMSVASTPALFRVRKTDAAGAQFSVARFPLMGTSSCDAGWSCYFRVGAADVTAAIALTLTGSGAGNARIDAAATSPAYFRTDDVGPATDEPNAPVLS